MGARDFLQHLSGAGLSVRLDGDRLIVGPSQLLTGELRQSIQAYKADLLALLKPAPPVNEPAPVEGSNGKVQGRVARLLAVGLDTERAEELSQWMGRRPAEADDRRLCIECASFVMRGKLCSHRGRISIQAPRELGDLATLPQRCPGFSGGATDA